MKITVREECGGWVVVGAETMGPFSTRKRAVDLAEGIVGVLLNLGERAELSVEVVRARIGSPQPQLRPLSSLGFH